MSEEQVKFVTIADVNAETGANYTQEEADMANEIAGAVAPVAAAKRPRKLEKEVDGDTVVITVIDGEKGEQRFNIASLSEEIQHKFIAFGLGHKLGDAAAGRSGKDAEEAIDKVWEGLVKGDWSVRAPAAQKVSLTDIKNNLSNLSEEEQVAAKALLAQMGIKVA